MNILDTMADDQVFGSWFERGDWTAWRAFLAVAYGLPMDADQRRIAQSCTGRSAFSDQSFTEVWLVVGRRGGKSFIIAVNGAYLAAFRDYSPYLARGERAVVVILASDRRQSRVIYRYILAFFRDVPMLAALVERETADGLQLSNGVDIEIHTASFRAVRGYTLAAVLADETAYWRSDESANPDMEILEALRPGMATIPGAILFGIGSPYAKRGAMWEAYRRNFGRDDAEALVWQADSRTMNPTLDQKVVDRAFERDPERARAEYGAQFRSDLESFVSEDAVHRVTIPDRTELPFVRYTAYEAFVDPSGGSRDSFTLAIAHTLDDGTAVLDCLREIKAPFSPEDATRELCDTLKTYEITVVRGDRYAGEWPAERFREHGIEYQTSDKAKSDLYKELLPLVNSRRIELLDSPRLHAQLVSLERRTARGGRDSIDHPPGAHDDLVNSAAGALVAASRDSSLDVEAFHAVEADYSHLGMSPRDTQELRGQWAEASSQLDEFLNGGL